MQEGLCFTANGVYVTKATAPVVLYFNQCVSMFSMVCFPIVGNLQFTFRKKLFLSFHYKTMCEYPQLHNKNGCLAERYMSRLMTTICGRVHLPTVISWVYICKGRVWF